MDFYEELGLDRSATPEVIHRAYRNLTRLLHPDQQQDGELRRLAELQMRRVNEIFAVLNDPIARKRYDSELTGQAWVPFIPDDAPIAGWGQRVRGGAWVIAAALGVAGISWYLTREGGRTTAEPSVARVEIVPPTPAALPAKSNRRRVSLQQQESKRSERRPTAQAAVKRSSPELPPVLPVLTPEAASVLAPSLGVLTASAASKFEGTWFYVAPAQRLDPSLYPPEFIEAVIRARDGWIEGRYRARYTVRDRAISPNVAFTFEGVARNTTTNLRWTGSGDAHGEVSLRLLSDSRLEIIWTAAELGTKMGLAAGTAVLIRRLETE